MMYYSLILQIILLIILNITKVISDEAEVIEILKKRILSLDQYIIKKPHNNCNLSKFVKITEIPYGRRYVIFFTFD